MTLPTPFGRPKVEAPVLEPELPIMGAVIEGDYRYKLWRTFNDPRKVIIWIMLNPSVADHEKDDNTIRKITKFSGLWGHGRLIVYNLFALRSTDPDAMKAHAAPIGVRNDDFLREAVASTYPIVCAWGRDGRHLNRDLEVAKSIFKDRKVSCLKVNGDGTPAHPLYLPFSQPLIPWKAAA